MKLGTAIAEIMKREGIEILCGYPVNHLIEYAANADIRPIMVRQERIGLHMADAISRVTSGHSIGAFCMQHGPGAENAMGGVAQCLRRVRPRAGAADGLCAPDCQHRAELQFQPGDEGVFEILRADQSRREVGNIFRRAFTKLKNGRGGPVIVEIPADMWNEEVPEPLNYTPVLRTRYGADPVHVKEAAALLANAKRPVIYAGQGVHYAKAWPQLKRLAERLAIPVTTSLGGKSSFPETHPLSLGSGGLAVPRAVPKFLAEADVIFGIGCSFTETSFGIAMPKGKTIIHSTLDPNHLNKDVEAKIGLVGDAGAGARRAAGGDRQDRHMRIATPARWPPRSQPPTRSGSRNGCRSSPTMTRRSIPIACCGTCSTPSTSRTPSSPMMPAARATSSRRSGRRSSRSPISAGARPPSSATASGLRWAPSWQSRTSSASTSGAMPRSASPAWISRPRCASGSRSCRSC